MYLSDFAKKVSIIIRKDSLDSTMSRYLIDQINKTPNISLVTDSAIVEMTGETRLECIVIVSSAVGAGAMAIKLVHKYLAEV